MLFRSVKAPGPAISEAGCKTEAPEAQTPPKRSVIHDTVAPVRDMMKTMVQLVAHIERTFVPKLRAAGEKGDLGWDTRLEFLKLASSELNIPYDVVFKIYLDVGLDGTY